MSPLKLANRNNVKVTFSAFQTFPIFPYDVKTAQPSRKSRKRLLKVGQKLIRFPFLSQSNFKSIFKFKIFQNLQKSFQIQICKSNFIPVFAKNKCWRAKRLIRKTVTAFWSRRVKYFVDIVRVCGKTFDRFSTEKNRDSHSNPIRAKFLTQYKLRVISFARFGLPWFLAFVEIIRSPLTP